MYSLHRLNPTCIRQRSMQTRKETTDPSGSGTEKSKRSLYSALQGCKEKDLQETRLNPIMQWTFV